MSSLTSNEKAEILDVQRRWVDAEVSGNVGRIGHLCTEDVVSLPQGAVLLRGRQAISSLWSIEDPRIASIDNSDVEIAGSDATAVKVARFETRFAVQGDSTTPQPVSGYHVWILRRNEGGEWRVAFFINSTISVWSFYRVIARIALARSSSFSASSLRSVFRSRSA